jgi:hypothetical protein
MTFIPPAPLTLIIHRVGEAATRLTVVIFASVSDLCSAGGRGRGPDGRVGWRRFHWPVELLGLGCGRRARAGQVGTRSAKAARNAASSSRAQGQVSGILIFLLRWPRTNRTAVCRIR